jgi:hypothetical protein
MEKKQRAIIRSIKITKLQKKCNTALDDKASGQNPLQM